MFGVGVSSRVAACVVLNFPGSQDAWCLGMSWLLLSLSSCFTLVISMCLDMLRYA